MFIIRDGCFFFFHIVFFLLEFGWCMYTVCPLEVSDALCFYRLVAAFCLNELIFKYSTLDLFPWKLFRNWISFCSRTQWNHLDCRFCYLMSLQFIFNPCKSWAVFAIGPIPSANCNGWLRAILERFVQINNLSRWQFWSSNTPPHAALSYRNMLRL